MTKLSKEQDSKKQDSEEQDSKSESSNGANTLSQAEADDASSALIARILAENAMDCGGSYYYSQYTNYSQGRDMYNGNNSDLDGDFEDQSDDYSPSYYVKSKKSKAKGKKSQRGKKRKNASVDTGTNDTEITSLTLVESASSSSTSGGTGETVKTQNSNKTKEKEPLSPVHKIKCYSEQEEKLFLEGLDLHGRNWKELSRHMGTRDIKSIRSHAQKHFVKLFLNDEPLPPKVRETGEGHTHSGEELTADNATLRAYLPHFIARIRSGLVTKYNPRIIPWMSEYPENPSKSPKNKPKAHKNVKSVKSAEPTSDIESQSDAVSKDLPTPINSSQAPNETEQSTVDLDVGHISKKSRNQNSPQSVRNNPRSKKEDNLPVTTIEDSGRTNYAASRLRPTANKNHTYETIDYVQDDFKMVQCEPFSGKPGTDTVGAQPFEMTVHTNALLLMDFHAHLKSAEIIGYLGGEWDRKTKKLTVKEAFPCQSLNTGRNEINVEMDPASSLEVRQIIEEKGMIVVGWYHSHPIFLPDPSLVDIDNQMNHQKFCRDELHATTPEFSPLNIMQDSIEETALSPLCNDENNMEKPQVPDLTTTTNSSNGNTSTTTSSISPRLHQMTLEPFVGAIVSPYDPNLPTSASVFNLFYVSRNEKNAPKTLQYNLQEDSTISAEEEDRMFELPILYQGSIEKINFGDTWRPDSQETRLEKLIKSLGIRMPWVQKKVLKLQQEMGLASCQNDLDDSSSDVDGTHIGESDSDDDLDVAKNQVSTLGDDDKLTDPLLEKVQATLKYW